MPADWRPYGQTDMTNLKVAFKNFANPSRNDFRRFFSCFSLSPSVELFPSFGRRVISDLKDWKEMDKRHKIQVAVLFSSLLFSSLLFSPLLFFPHPFSSFLVSSLPFSPLPSSSVLISSLLISSRLVWSLLFRSLLLSSGLFSSVLFSYRLFFSFLISSLPFCSVLFSTLPEGRYVTERRQKKSLNCPLSLPKLLPWFLQPHLYSSVSAPWCFKYVHQTCKFWSSWYRSLWLDKGYSKYHLVVSESSVYSNTWTKIKI